MIRINLDCILLIGVLLSVHVGLSAQDSPNVVVIVADDFGWTDVSYQGSEFYETPNLDTLAAEGMVFTNGYASCGVCSPSRASLLTGRYTPRSGITDWIRGYQAEKTPEQLDEYKLVGPENVYNLPLEEITLAEAMKQAGYKTCFVGKWHLGEEDAYYPHNQGFDKNVAGWKKGSPSGSRTNKQSYYTPYYNPYLSDGAEGEFLTDRLVDESINWINENKSNPFLLYLSFYVVHTPIHPKPEKIPYYTNKAQQMGLSSLAQTTKDVDWINNHPNPKWHWEERLIQGSPDYAALIESMDENIGRVLRYLKDSGLDENTIVVFTSDNGGLSTAETSPTSNAPLRAGKGWLYEGGIREPFLLKIPGQTTPGTVSDVPVHGIDIYPTILDACNISVPNPDDIDGLSLMSLVKGDGIAREKLFWHYPHYGGKGDAPAGAIRKGDYKLIELFETGEVELYNLKNDISESNDLSDAMPEKKEELLQDLKQWQIDIGAKMPVENEYYKYKAAESGNLKVFVNDKVAINPDIFGVNNDWKFITDEQFPTFASTCKNLNLGVLRYPGGWESEWVNWSSNTAPSWPDAPDDPGASITTVKSNYQNYSVVVPTRLALNHSYNSTNWNNAIESLKLTAKDAIDRTGPNNFKYLEIGNEWWLQYAGGVSRSDKLINYSKTAMKIAAYLAEQYPDRTFKILINGDFTEPDEFTTIKANFTEAYNEIDGLALHTYTGYHPPSEDIGFAIQTLGEKIDACAKNFNQNKDLIIYCSEWMAARAYNESRVYMEVANIIPDIIQIYARHGVDAAAYWPPINSTAPGVGLVNWNASVVYPCGQILSEMATSYTGEAVRTISGDIISISGALVDNQNLVLYISGKNSPSTNVVVDVNNFNISSVKKVTKFRPYNYTQTDLAAPYVTETASVNLTSSSSFNVDVNKLGQYEIFKVELQGDFIEAEASDIIDFESPVDYFTESGATFEVVENQWKGDLNSTDNCGKLGRTSSLWYELTDLACNFSIPANEFRFVHAFIKYPAQPDVILRLNQSGNEGNVRPLNTYTNIGEWQDLVFEYYGGDNGIQVDYLRFLGDCGFENNPAGLVLDNSSNFGYIDEIIISEDPTPRGLTTSIFSPSDNKFDYSLYTRNHTLYFTSNEGKQIPVWVFDLNGRLIKKYNQSEFTLNIPVVGLYLVRVDNHVQKVIIH